MTFLDLQNLVAYWLDDLNFGYFTPIQVKRWINNAQFEVQKLLVQAGENWYLTCAETTTVQNQQCYAQPSDFLKVNRLSLVLDGVAPNENLSPLQFITLNQQDLIGNKVGQPEAYSLSKNLIYLWPTPQTPQVMKLDYTYKVAPMVNDAEVADVPEQYREFIAVLAALDGLLKDGRDPGPMLEKKAYYEAMLKSDADERNQDSPRQIVVTNDSGFGSLF